MFVTSEFSKSIWKSINLFSNLSILRTPLNPSSKNLSEEFRTISRDKNINYAEIYRCGLSKKDYNILLNDYSYFQYTNLSTTRQIKLSYSYYPNPSHHISYNEFLTRYEFDDEQSTHELYMEMLAQRELDLKKPPLRYDVDYESYTELKHPICHLHFGISENRMPIDFVFSPFLFSLMVAKLFYFKEWDENNNNKSFILRTLEDEMTFEKEKCIADFDTTLSEKELKQLFIT